ASASAIFCAVEASLESRATTVAMGEGSGMAQLLRPIPDIHRRLSRPRVRQFTNWSTTIFTAQLPEIRCNTMPSADTQLILILSAYLLASRCSRWQPSSCTFTYRYVDLAFRYASDCGRLHRTDLEIEDAMRVQLTDRFCASAKSTEAQTDYFDATIPGLALRVTSGGTKSWSLLHGTPSRRVSLGRYPSLSLAAARGRAVEVKDGRSAGTVAALAEVYLRSIQGLRSVGQIERRLRKDILPIIGHIQLHELHRRDVTRVIDAKLLDAPITARRVFEDIRAMVRWSVARGDLDHNPIDGMKGPPISKPRTRVLSDDEIRA